MLNRALYETLIKNLAKQKVTILLGARRVGKTILLRQVFEANSSTSLWLNGEDAVTATVLAEQSVSNYQRLLQGKTLLIIDEAQYIENIGRKVKLMIDEINHLHIIITGSSAFDLHQQSGEPLVGRSITQYLYPVAQMELSPSENPIETTEKLPERLVFGSYPEVITTAMLAEKRMYLQELVGTYLLKDILAFESIRNPQKLRDLLTLIAWQIGKEVSTDELGRQLQMSKNTVDKYLDLLAKSFIIYKRGGFSKNLRKEVSKSSRWYFFDNGVRNALINNFSMPHLRQDIGMLWENYILSERLKYNSYTQQMVSSFFWRTYDQQEIDLIEEENGVIKAYEMKYNAKKSKPPVAFEKAYQAEFTEISQQNYLNFIT